MEGLYSPAKTNLELAMLELREHVRYFTHTRAAGLCDSERCRCTAASLLKSAKQTDRKSYIANKEELEEGIPERRYPGEGSIDLAACKTLALARHSAPLLFCAHSWPCAASDRRKSASAAPTTRQQPLRPRAHASGAYQLISFKSRIDLRGARQRR